MNFDEIIERRGTHCAKWDMMEKIYGVPQKDGIAMWVADMDFHPPACVQRALKGMLDHGVYGYYGDDTSYKDAIIWWMKNRHDWEVDADAIFTTHGLVNGTAMCIDAFTQPGDGVVLFTPVYHSFARVTKAAGRDLRECPLVIEDDVYKMDFAAYDKMMQGNEKILIFCSPHNPGGRVWTREELEGVCEFARRHDLVLVSDEIHHDLVFPGAHHIPMTKIDGISDRLVMMTATTKTFNIAGAHSGNVIIPDPKLRATFANRMAALGMSANSFGIIMAEAAYCPEGAQWVDAVVTYIDDNRKLFDAAIASIPGLVSMPLEATYLAWVNFADTGMDKAEYLRRVEQEAKLAVNHGETFGKGGESFLRFNLATPRALVDEACDRLKTAFADLQ